MLKKLTFFLYHFVTIIQKQILLYFIYIYMYMYICTYTYVHILSSPSNITSYYKFLSNHILGRVFERLFYPLIPFYFFIFLNRLLYSLISEIVLFHFFIFYFLAKITLFFFIFFLFFLWSVHPL